MCDSDIDGDGVNNDKDNARDVANKDREDDDQDKVGNVVDKCLGRSNLIMATPTATSLAIRATTTT